jgi:predicted nucleic acid-binding protein
MTSSSFMYLDLALAAGAKLVISSGKDLLTLGGWGDLQLLHPHELLAVTAEGADKGDG